MWKKFLFNEFKNRHSTKNIPSRRTLSLPLHRCEQKKRAIFQNTFFPPINPRPRSSSLRLFTNCFTGLPTAVPGSVSQGETAGFGKATPRARKPSLLYTTFYMRTVSFSPFPSRSPPPLLLPPPRSISLRPFDPVPVHHPNRPPSLLLRYFGPLFPRKIRSCSVFLVRSLPRGASASGCAINAMPWAVEADLVAAPGWGEVSCTVGPRRSDEGSLAGGRRRDGDLGGGGGAGVGGGTCADGEGEAEDFSLVLDVPHLQ